MSPWRARLEADGRWYVGPGNGLFEPVQRRAGGALLGYRLDAGACSASFHGRDIFAPVAARLALGETPTGRQREADVARRADWPDDLSEVVYVDHFGNAMTGLRATTLPAETRLVAGYQVLERAKPLAIGRRARLAGTRNGLAEIAVNLGRADRDLGLEIGFPVAIVRQSRSDR